jgi:hypothetical protein
VRAIHQQVEPVLLDTDADMVALPFSAVSPRRPTAWRAFAPGENRIAGAARQLLADALTCFDAVVLAKPSRWGQVLADAIGPAAKKHIGETLGAGWAAHAAP